MSKVYNLPATLNTGRSSPDSSSDAWESYATWNEASSNLGKVGYDAWDYATNMLFDSSTLSTLRSKTIIGITLELNVTKGVTGSFYIGYKLNSTASGNTNSKAWARGNNAGTMGASADTVATVDNPSFTSISTGTRIFTLKNALPQYGLTSGSTSSNLSAWRFSSAILHVTTNEVTISYNKGSNGTGTNVSDIKEGSASISLRGAIFTRSGYIQTGWSTSDGGAKVYNLGASYSGTNDLVLYPYWTKQYVIEYSANGGTGAPSSQIKTHDVTLQLSSDVPTRTNYIFQGWATSSTGAVAYQPGDNYTANAAVTLYAIWQAAKSTLSTITSSVNIGSSGTASWNIVNSAYTFKLVITYGNAPAVTVNVAANTSSTSFTIPTTWYAYLPNVTSVTATATLTTYSGSTSLGSTTKTFTVAVASSVKPTISSFTHAPYSQNSTVNGWGVYVQGYSQVDLSVAASAGTGASIVSIAFSGTGISQSGTATTARSSVLSNTGYLDYSVTVTDSRGRSVTSSLSGTGRPYFYEYSNPVVTAMTAFRSNSSGVEDAISGTYIRTSASFTFSSCGNKNSLSVKKIEYKLHTASSWTSGVATATSGTAYTIGGGNIAITSSYDVRCTVTDALSHTTTYVVLVPPIVGFAVGLNNDRARFGGPVEKAGLQVDWDAEFHGVVDVVPRRCYAQLPTTGNGAGWYRVLTLSGDSNDRPLGSPSFVIDITIVRQYGSSNNELHKVSLLAVYNSIAFANETSKSNNAVVDKIRYMRNGKYGYIDIHYDTSALNIVTVHFDVKAYPLIDYQFAATTPTSVAASPSGETVLTEYTFAANTEGTITTPSAGVSGSQIIDSSSRRSGKVVSYHMSISSTSSSEISVSHGSVLATGLVPPDYMVITMGHYWYDTSKPGLRCQVTTAGNLQVYWDSGVIPKSGQSVVFEITYIAA